jgi:hypothetical protein
MFQPTLVIIRCFKLLVKTGRATQNTGILEHIDGATHQIFEPQNGSTAVATNNFKRVMMTSVSGEHVVQCTETFK